ncbi:MAG: hypothetical protein ACRD36_03095, partial [Candidatus Acidiferrum sp.]
SAGAQNTAAAPAARSFDHQPKTGLEPERANTRTYQAISMLALAGFALALLYALIVVAGSILAFVGGYPMLMPPWTATVPVAAALICWYARQNVLSSEGALGGAKLATVGFFLSMGLGLVYWAYVAATYLAVRQQASAFVEGQWFKLLKENRLPEAFMLSMQPPHDEIPAKALRNAVEINFNQAANDTKVGTFTAFTEREFVRFIGNAGGKTTLHLVSASMPKYEKSSLNIILVYHVDTPQISFDLPVLTKGFNVKSKEAAGRQWQVLPDSGAQLKESIQFTSAGDDLNKRSVAAATFVAKWLEKVAQNIDMDAAYLGTLQPAARASIQKKIAGKSQKEIAQLAANDAEVSAFHKGKAAFLNGDLGDFLRTDPATFWTANPEIRAAIIDEVKKRLRPSDALAGWITFSPVWPPLWSAEGGKLQFKFDANLHLSPKYMGLAQIVAEADLNNPALASDDAESWRILRIELVRGAPVPVKAPKKGRAGASR